MGYCVPFSTDITASGGFFSFGLFIKAWGAGTFLGENTGIRTPVRKHLVWARPSYKSMVIPRGCDRAKIRRKICQTARNELKIIAVYSQVGEGIPALKVQDRVRVRSLA